MTKKYIFLILLFSLTFVNTKAQIVLNHSDTTICRSSNINNHVYVSDMDSVIEIPANQSDIAPTGSLMGIPLGFNFSYFGAPFTHFGVGSNNLISLRNINLTYSVTLGAAGANWSNFIISMNNYYKVAIMLGFQDLETPYGGAIHYQIMGASGNRKLVVDYCKVAQNPIWPGGG